MDDTPDEFLSRNVESVLEEVSSTVEQRFRLFKSYDLARAQTDYASAGGLIPTYIQTLDDMGFGFRGGKIYAIAARPGSGKTTLMIELALRRAKALASGQAEGGPAVFVTYEERILDIYSKFLLCAAAHCYPNSPEDAPWRKAADKFLQGDTDGFYRMEHLSDLRKAAEEIDGLQSAGHLYLVDGDERYLVDGDERRLAEVDDLVTTLQEHSIEGVPGLLLTDYYQKVKPPRDSNSYSRQQQLQEVADTFRQYAKDNAVPVVMGAQVQRNVEGQPDLKDIREADDLANDAAGVLTLHHKDKAVETNDKLPAGGRDMWSSTKAREVTVRIVKNRDGRSDIEGQLHLYGASSHFRDATAVRNPNTLRGQYT
jgi:replicative DNA helicase